MPKQKSDETTQWKQDYELISESEDGSRVTYRRKDGSIGVMTLNGEESMTQQQFKDECDINNIIKAHGGDMRMLPPHVFVKSGRGVYGDFSDTKDFQQSLHTIMDAESAFMTLDAKIRAKFENDPQKLFQFLNKKENFNEAVSLGLIEKPNENTKTNLNENVKTTTKNDDQNS